jgi:hypothetical protein
MSCVIAHHFTDSFTDSGQSATRNSLLNPRLGLVPVVGLEPTRLC